MKRHSVKIVARSQEFLLQELLIYWSQKWLSIQYSLFASPCQYRRARANDVTDQFLYKSRSMIRSQIGGAVRQFFMAEDSRHFTDIKDIRPGIKNLHCLFIVLEVGKPALSSDTLPVWSEAKFTAISCREGNQNERCSRCSGMPRSRQNRLDYRVCLGWSRWNSSTRRYH